MVLQRSLSQQDVVFQWVSMGLVTVHPPILSVFWGNFSLILLLYPGECYFWFPIFFSMAGKSSLQKPVPASIKNGESLLIRLMAWSCRRWWQRWRTETNADIFSLVAWHPHEQNCGSPLGWRNRRLPRTKYSRTVPCIGLWEGVVVACNCRFLVH